MYINVGCDQKAGAITCNVVTASPQELLQSSNENTSSSQVWHKLRDMPYSSLTINHFQRRLITFSGFHRFEQPIVDNLACQSAPLIHIYNPYSNTWVCVGDVPYDYLIGR